MYEVAANDLLIFGTIQGYYCLPIGHVEGARKV